MDQAGIDYNFFDQNAMERSIRQNVYVEYGMYGGNWYGTRMAAIREIGQSGKVAIIPLHPCTLKLLKASDLKPYVVYLKPKDQRNWTPGGHSSNGELVDPAMMEEAQRIETSYGHYFDLTLVVEDVRRAAEELIQVADRLQDEPQWMYADWVR